MNKHIEITATYKRIEWAVVFEFVIVRCHVIFMSLICYSHIFSVVKINMRWSFDSMSSFECRLTLYTAEANNLSSAKVNYIRTCTLSVTNISSDANNRRTYMYFLMTFFCSMIERIYLYMYEDTFSSEPIIYIIIITILTLEKNDCVTCFYQKK